MTKSVQCDQGVPGFELLLEFYRRTVINYLILISVYNENGHLCLFQIFIDLKFIFEKKRGKNVERRSVFREIFQGIERGLQDQQFGRIIGGKYCSQDRK